MSFAIYAMEDRCGFNDCCKIPFVKCKSDVYVRYDYTYEYGEYLIKIEPLCRRTNLSNEESYRLGVCYIEGWGVPINIEAAISCFEFAAGQGDSDSMFELGLLYSQDMVYIEKAILWYACYISVTQDYRGMYNLGSLYHQINDLGEARKWIYYAKQNGSQYRAFNWLEKYGYPTNNMLSLMDAVAEKIEEMKAVLLKEDYSIQTAD